MDLVVEDPLVVEKQVPRCQFPVHRAQILSYLKLSGKSIGLLINFNVSPLKDGIKRFVNGTQEGSDGGQDTKVHEGETGNSRTGTLPSYYFARASD